jgi:CheY-like chemotaxis protein
MNITRVLVVEDDPGMPGFIISKLTGMGYEFELRTTSDLAISLTSQTHFDVVFVDLELRKEHPGILEGIGVTEKIRSHLPDSVIAIYSSHITHGEETKFNQYADCVRVGADAVYARTDLFSVPAAELHRRITELIARKKSARDARLNIRFNNDLRTRASCDTFGTDALETILAATVPLAHLKVSALEVGYSGAAVFRVIGASHPTFSTPSELVVKVSRSEFSLRDELARRPLPGTRFANSSAIPHNEKVIHKGDLSAIAIPEVKDRVSLRTFLLDECSSSAGIQRVCSQLVSELLTGPASESRTWESFDLPSDPFELKATALLEISDFLHLAAGWKVVDVRYRAAINASRTLLDQIADGRWVFRSSGKHAALLHGDFHARNIFVSRHHTPLLIDFGRACVYPRLFDFASLDADLLLAVSDSPNGREHDFSRIDQWLRETRSAFPFRPKTLKGRNCGAPSLFRRAMLSQMVREVKDVSVAEYSEVLMFQCFRYLRFSNVALPKKIFACQVIDDLSKLLQLQPTND